MLFRHNQGLLIPLILEQTQDAGTTLGQRLQSVTNIPEPTTQSLHEDHRQQKNKSGNRPKVPVELM